MNEKLMRILDAREERWIKKTSLAAREKKAVISVTLRMPEEMRTKREAEDMFSVFIERLQKAFSESGVSVCRADDGFGADGPYGFFLTDDADKAKRASMRFEDDDACGSLLDVDVMAEDMNELSRLDYGYPPRKCAVCSVHDARFCAKSGAHTKEETLTAFRKLCKNVLDGESL